MRDSQIKSMVLTAVMAAVLCVLGPLSIPIGPVPISLATFVIYIMLYILGMKRSCLAVLIYLLIGFAGLPVFSGFSGGPSKLLGPSGGYLPGYLLMAAIAGLFVEKMCGKIIPSAAGMLLGTAALYAVGTVWLAFVTGMSATAAISAGVLPFIPLDLFKIAAAAVLGPAVRRLPL